MEDKVSVIIPTLNAEHELPQLLCALNQQKHHIDELIVVDSESNDKTVDICEANDKIKLLHVKRRDFDHGRTRDLALRSSIGNIVIFLTQDAIPVDDDFIGNIIQPLKNADIAVSTGRQIPKANATDMERLVRQFNYPSESYVRSKDDIPQMGIKAFFSSDVCAAYRKDIYLALGGFDYPLKTNEDMFFAAKAINAGYKISYTADAKVYHSHNFTLKEQYKRNYIQGYEIEKNKAILSNVSQESEGIRLVKYVSANLIRQGQIASFIRFGFDCVARLLGSRQGRKAYRKLLGKQN